MNDLISVIVSTYNRPDALSAVLRGLSRQTDRRFEIVVADDGSGSETAEVIEGWKDRMAAPLRRAWHSDRGFRLAEIRNRAIQVTRGAVCIFLDGDCIPRPAFVAAHRSLAAPGFFVAGTRVLLGQSLTQHILDAGLEPELWGPAEWCRVRARGEVNRVLPLLKLPLGPFRHLHARRWQGARGGNLAVRTADLWAVDGFDASFEGWGLEDTDLVVRLFRHGVRRKDGRFATAVLHLWHPESDRSGLPANVQRLAAVLAGNTVKAVKGLSSLADAAPKGPPEQVSRTGKRD
ncbi:MAG: glycosyltransferase family 2 protein [Variibacter sp.]|nr:glycosyltransferase family 2 protein [Variibacter sp.]